MPTTVVHMCDRDMAAGLEEFLKLSCRKYIEPYNDDNDVEIAPNKIRQKVEKHQVSIK